MQSQPQSQTIILEPPLYFSQENAHIWNTSFHPNQNILACGIINGVVEILKYDSQDVNRVLKIDTLHKGSVRWVTFNKEGTPRGHTVLATCSQDKRLGFVNTDGKVAHIIKKAHTEPINRCEFIDQHIFMSGDDNGTVKLWDLRTTQSIFQVSQQQNDAITSLRYDPKHTNIITSCLDGTVAVYDIKKGNEVSNDDKLFSISDSIDQQLNGLQTMKNGKYLICPSSESSLVMYRRDNLQQNYVDRLQGFPGSVDAMLKIDEQTLIVGSEDGFVRGVSIKPNKILQVIGQHEQDENYPIQSLGLSYCGNILASTSHDNSIKFYDVSEFVKKRIALGGMVKKQQNELGEQEMQEIEESSMELCSLQGGENARVKKEQQMNEKDEMMEYDSDSDDDSDDDDDSDSDMQDNSNTKKKKKVSHKASIKGREKELKRQKQQSFFKGL